MTQFGFLGLQVLWLAGARAGGLWNRLFPVEEQQVPSQTQFPPPSLNATGVAPSVVVVTTTSVSFVTSAVSPTSMQMSPSQSFELRCSIPTVLPDIFRPYTNATVESGGLGSNISTIFNLTNSTHPDFCGARLFCSTKLPGLYCYRTVDPCKRSPLLSAGGGGDSSDGGKHVDVGGGSAKNELGGDSCLPVAMVLCPQAMFIGCTEGYACQDEDEPWWDDLSSQSPMLSQPLKTRPNILQQNPSGPFGQNETVSGNNQTSVAYFHLASCRAIVEPTSMPTAKSNMPPCLLKAASPTTYFPAPTECQHSDTAKAAISSSSSSVCPATISTVWWWPSESQIGMANAVPYATASSDPCTTAASMKAAASASATRNPPPTCQGPYPVVPTPTLTIVYMSTYCPSAMLASATLTTTVASTQTEFCTTTVYQTIYSAETVTTTTTTTATATTTSTITPSPVLPSTVTVAAIETAVPTPAKGGPFAPVVTPFKASAIPAESFPSAGEPYEVYTSKAAAIASRPI